MASPKILVVAGPSGVGKGTVLGRIRADFGEAITFSVSHTTRKPRAGEVHGIQYYFVDRDCFEQMIKDGEFLEYAEFSGNLYGTSFGEIKRMESDTKARRVNLLEIELNGVQQLQRHPNLGKGQVCYIFLYPPSVETLMSRLKNRGTEDEVALRARLEIAKEEVKIMDRLYCDRKIVNDSLDVAVDQVKQAIQCLFGIFPAPKTTTNAPLE